MDDDTSHIETGNIEDVKPSVHITGVEENKKRGIYKPTEHQLGNDDYHKDDSTGTDGGNNIKTMKIQKMRH